MQLDFNAIALASKWKRWKEEIELYMDLAMDGKSERTKTKLFLHLVGSKGREIYETLQFGTPSGERTYNKS